MAILGFSAGFHDAAVSVVDHDGSILFAAHSERYTKQKHDLHISDGIIEDALKSCDENITDVVYYENPYLKKTRQIYSGQIADALHEPFLIKTYIEQHSPLLHSYVEGWKVPVTFASHHKAHAAAGFQTSPFDKATVVVIDAIGEWDTITIWGAEYQHGAAVYKKLWSQRYPHSIGLLYSSFTKRLGLRPMDEEYILMGMAGWGKPVWSGEVHYRYVNNDYLSLKENLHCGIDNDYLKHSDDFNIAASVQKEAEKMIAAVMQMAVGFNYSKNLVYMGGVALNCLANRMLGQHFDNIWIMPNPGDAGSSLGAAALEYSGKLRWESPYLGKNIEGDYPVTQLLDELQLNKIVGVANGRAEFGPRALGNRSLLADPRGKEIKDKVNAIKRRQKFRPFAPVILEEFVDQYFDMPTNTPLSPYMQVVAPCKFPDQFPAIIHVDGTSRVQTVSKDCKSGIRELLEKWYLLTDCPMLLNTSLNIRGEPMVNDKIDAYRFEKEYGVRVF
jgi:carbamoyltransferase